MNSFPAPRKVSYVVSIGREVQQETALSWKGNLETAAGQHLNFSTLAELNHLLCELDGWIDPPAELASSIPSND